MNSRTLLVAGGACLLAAGGLLLHGKKGDNPASQEAALPATAAPQPNPPPAAPSQPDSPATPAPAEEKLSDDQRTAILGKIEEASVTYDAKALPDIETYLLHPDPEVRTAALNGMIVLGEAGAASLLREAAKKAPTPKEAVALTEAADYLELPPGTFIPEERTAAGSRVPQGQAERSRPRLGTPRERVKSPDTPR